MLFSSDRVRFRARISVEFLCLGLGEFVPLPNMVNNCIHISSEDFSKRAPASFFLNKQYEQHDHPASACIWRDLEIKLLEKKQKDHLANSSESLC